MPKILRVILIAVVIALVAGALPKPLKSLNASVAMLPRKHDSIVRLHEAASGRFFCSGTVISPTLVLTAAHCIDGTAIEVRTADEAVHVPVDAIVGLNRAGDLAIIHGDFRAFKAARISTDPAYINTALEQHKVIMCGYPWAGALYCSKFSYVGILFFQVLGKGFLYPGMSGGPVIDLDTGTIVGVNTGVRGVDMVISPLIAAYEQIGSHEQEANK